MLPILYGFNNSLSYLYFGFRYGIWQQNSFCAILNNGHLISVCRFMCIGIHAFHECDSCSCSGQCPASSHDIWSFGTIYAFWGLQCTWPISTYRKLISCPVCGEAQDGGHQLTSWWTQTYALWGRCYVVVLIFPTTSCFFVLDYNLCWRSKLDITDSILKPLAWLCRQYIWCFNINQII